MLEVFVQCCLALFVCSVLGLSVCNTFNIKLVNPVKTIFMGLFSVAIISRIWHFFFAVDEKFIGLVVIFCLILYLRRRIGFWQYYKPLTQSVSKNWILVLFSSVFLIYLASLTSISYDDGLYHAQFIKFINSYPEIKGLANLHGRFGFNSNWHLLSAVFNGYGIWAVQADCINAFLVISFILYFCWESQKRETYRFAISFTVFPVILIYHFIDPSADMTIILFSFALFIDLIEDNLTDGIFWPFAMAFLITVKVNSVLLLPAVVYLLFKMRQHKNLRLRRDAIMIATGSLLLIIPWLISNIILSGYLIYPFVSLPLQNPIWTVPLDQVGREIMRIKYTPVVRWSGITYERASHMSVISQLQLWWHALRIVEKLTIAVFLIAACASVVISSSGKRVTALLLLLLLVVSIGLVPDIRFFAGYGFAAIFLSLTSFDKVRFYVQQKKLVSTMVCAQCLLTFVLYVHLFRLVWNQGADMCMINPIGKSGYQCGHFASEDRDGVTIYYPVNNESCWDSCPCELKKNVKLRLFGNDVKYGFYQVNDLAINDK